MPHSFRPHGYPITLFFIMLIAVSGLTLIVPGQLLTTGHAAAMFVVTNTNDSGAGSLNQAILDANANPGADLITFNIGSGAKTITPTTLLPTITDPVVIDGTTQPGFSGSPLIELSAISTPSFGNRGMLHITAGNTTVRSLVINHFRDFGIALVTVGGNHVEGCYIGTDITGSLATGSNGNGIAVNDSPNNVIGGTTPHSGNVISGIRANAISIFGFNGDGNQILGNYIGVNAPGTAALGNFAGIYLGTSNNIVGGTTPEARNVISDNEYAGIVMQEGGTSGNVIQGNYIGTNAGGNVAFGNENYGIAIFNPSNNNTIGGTSPGAGNVVSGNGWGISIAASSGEPSGNVVQGNYVGVAADGFTPLGNRVEGVRLAGAVNTTVGGIANGAGNIIAFNGRTAEIGVGTGLEMLTGTNNSIRGNSIFSNGRLGIDLDASGVTQNDPGDGDSGGNNRQNFPLISSVVSQPSQTTINGTLNSMPNTTFTIDFYSNGACDPSGNGEGAKPFGLVPIMVTTDGSGNAIFGVALSTVLPAGRVITATATDPSGNTSEFSPCDITKAMGSAQFASTSYTVNEDVGFATITVNRVGGSLGNLTVDYLTADLTASAGQDYTAVSGTLTFMDGETSKTFDVPIADNNSNEVDETVALLLRNPASPDAAASQSMALLTIQNHNMFVALSIDSISVAEGDVGTSNAVFTVSLSAATGRTITVGYSTTPLEATPDVDYQPVAGSLTFNPRVTTQTINVPIIGDRVDEIDERFRVRLNNAVNAQIANSAIGTIVDDDLPLTVSINNVSVNEGNSGTAPAVFTVSLSAASDKIVSVGYATAASGTASSPSDYAAATGNLTFNPGETFKTLTVTVNGDTQDEPNETFFVNLTSTTNVTAADAQGMGTILNDDGTTLPLQLMLDDLGPDATVRAAALDSMLFLRDPFPLINSGNLLNPGPDRNTRLLIFVNNLQVAQGEPAFSVVVNLVDSNGQSYDLAAVDVRAVPGFNFMQVIFRLPNNASAGTATLKVLAHSQTSNSATIRLSP